MKYKPALLEALNLLPSRMNQLKSKRLEIQLSAEEERQIEEHYALFEKKYNSIQKMCHELNKPFE